MKDSLADPYALEGSMLQGRYAVGAPVARGGFGVVYRARRVDLDLPVALKVLFGVERFTGSARDEMLARFRQEARTLAALAHPAVARVVDYGTLPHTSGEVPWMALDWIDGVTLEDDLRARGGEGRSPHEVLDLLRPAFDALACAHEAGISHRDLKPSNLMLTKPRRGEVALRVIDFGVAKVAPDEGATSGDTATRSEVQAFSVLYAAPEQVGRTRTGPWTDVHALGLVVTEALTGDRAYRSDDGPALLLEIVGAERPTPGRQGVRVGPWEIVLARALAVAPSERPADAAKLFRELEASVAEAQAAWELSPRAPRRPLGPAAETLAPAAAPPPRPPATAPSRAASRWRRLALPLAVVAIASLALAAGLHHRERAVAPPPPRRPVAAPSPVVPPQTARVLAPAPAPPAAPAAPRTAPTTPRRPAVAATSTLRRPAPAPPRPAPAPAAAEPVPYVAIE